MKKLLKEMFDNRPPRYGLLSNAQRTILFLGMILGLGLSPFSIELALFFTASSLVIVYFL